MERQSRGTPAMQQKKKSPRNLRRQSVTPFHGAQNYSHLQQGRPASASLRRDGALTIVRLPLPEFCRPTRGLSNSACYASIMKTLHPCPRSGPNSKARECGRQFSGRGKRAVGERGPCNAEKEIRAQGTCGDREGWIQYVASLFRLRAHALPSSLKLRRDESP